LFLVMWVSIRSIFPMAAHARPFRDVADTRGGVARERSDEINGHAIVGSRSSCPGRRLGTSEFGVGRRGINPAIRIER
jgi:hypothetical protein